MDGDGVCGVIDGDDNDTNNEDDDGDDIGDNVDDDVDAAAAPNVTYDND